MCSLNYFAHADDPPMRGEKTPTQSFFESKSALNLPSATLSMFNLTRKQTTQKCEYWRVRSETLIFEQTRLVQTFEHEIHLDLHAIRKLIFDF